MDDALTMLLVVGLLAAGWIWAATGRDRALLAVQRVCRELSLTRLDDSVYLTGCRLSRDGNRWRLLRRYRFEFTLDGVTRHPGEVTLIDGRPGWAEVTHPDGLIHLDLRPAPVTWLH